MTATAALPERADAVVIGAGVAGLSAGVRLAGQGLRVVVVEEAPRLGGRATSFVDRETNEPIDNGQHALFGCYRQTYAFLRTIDAAHLAPLQRQLTLTMAGEGRVARLRCPRLPSPWHLLAGLIGWKAIPLADRLKALRLRRVMRAVASRGAAAVASSVAPDATVSMWLRSQGQSPAMCDWLWRPLAFAAMNQSPDVAAAGPFVRVLGEMFASDAESSAVGLPATTLDRLFSAPAAAFIAARGGTVVTRTRGQILLTPSGELRGVRAGDVLIAAPITISAVPWHAFGRLWEAQVPNAIAGIAGTAAAMKNSPIVTVNLWLETGRAGVTELPAPFVGFTDGPMHWLFDKAQLVGGGAKSLSMVASGAEDLARLDNERIVDMALAQLRQAFPAVGVRRLQRSVVVREHRATFSLAPGSPARPSTLTPLGGFFLAGDWTDTGLPATIEGAVRSGHAAADAALSAHVIRR